MNEAMTTRQAQAIAEGAQRLLKALESDFPHKRWDLVQSAMPAITSHVLAQEQAPQKLYTRLQALNRLMTHKMPYDAATAILDALAHLRKGLTFRDDGKTITIIPDGAMYSIEEK